MKVYNCPANTNISRSLNFIRYASTEYTTKGFTRGVSFGVQRSTQYEAKIEPIFFMRKLLQIGRERERERQQRRHAHSAAGWVSSIQAKRQWFRFCHYEEALTQSPAVGEHQQ